MASVEARTIRTDSGALELIPATIEQLRGIARYWPMELVGDADDSGSFGLVFQRGDQEVHGIKMQPVDIDEEDAKRLHHINRALIAAALPHYLAKQHQGLMLPCAYYKEKSRGKAESGIAFFVGPDPASAPISATKMDVLFDKTLGAGGTQMAMDMVGAISKARKECHLPLMAVIGMDLRPRLAIGGLAMHFVIEGPRVIVIKHPLQDEEPVWEYAVRAGFSKLPYAPMMPVGFAAPTDAGFRHV